MSGEQTAVNRPPAAGETLPAGSGAITSGDDGGNVGSGADFVLSKDAVSQETTATASGKRDASPGRRILRSLLLRPAGAVGVAITVVMVGAGVLAPVLAPHSPLYQFPNGLLQDGSPVGPSMRFLLGTDALGRDLLSRLLFGIRETLEVAVAANVVSTVVGVVIGFAAGYVGRWLDLVLMRVTEVLLAIPAILLAAFLALVTRPSTLSLTIIIGAVNWYYLARIVRAEVQSVKGREFVQAAVGSGASHSRVLLRHIWPQVLPLVLVYTTLQFSTTAMFVAAMSFVGIGIQPPTPALGNLIAEGSQYLTSVPRLAAVPGIALGLLVLGFNLLGDALHDALSPKSS